MTAAVDTSVATDVVGLRGVTKAFPGVRALTAVDLEFRRGRVTGLIGPNGAGKSTAIGVLTGRLRPDVGSVVVDGEPVSFTSMRDASSVGIEVIPQELVVADDLTVAENLLLGSVPRRGLFVDSAGLRRRAAEVAARVGLDLDVETRAGDLAPAEKRLVMIGRAVSRDCRFIIMDEPTASLSPREVDVLMSIVRDLTAHGIGVLYVSHRLSEVKALCADVTVMRDGQTVFTGPTDELEVADLVRLMGDVDLDHVAEGQGPSAVMDDVVLDARGLGGGPISGADLQVRRGEVVGIGGLVGSGRTELLRLLAGADRVEAGELEWSGHPARGGLRGALRRGVVLLPEDRRNQGGFQALSLRENVSLPSLHRLGRARLFVRRAAERAEVRTALASVAAPTGRDGAALSTLSGGNQQKVLIAKWMLTSPTVYLFDEPSAGIDVHAKEEIRKQIRELAAEGAGVVVVSSDNEELPTLCDRVVVMREGRIMGGLVGPEITPAAILRLSYGGDAAISPLDAALG